MTTVNTIIFDLGNVLVRLTTEGSHFGRLMRAIGIEPADAFSTYWFTAEIQQHMTGDIDPAEFYRLAKERFAIPHTYEEFVEGWCDIFEPVPGMREVFDQVSSRYTVGLLSDTDPLHWEKISSDYPWLASAAPSLSYDIGFLKPHPAMYETAARNCGKQKHECLFIDDKLDNVDGARHHGMPALLFQGTEKLIKDLTGLGVLKPQ